MERNLLVYNLHFHHFKFFKKKKKLTLDANEALAANERAIFPLFFKLADAISCA